MSILTLAYLEKHCYLFIIPLLELYQVLLFGNARQRFKSNTY